MNYIIYAKKIRNIRQHTMIMFLVRDISAWTERRSILQNEQATHCKFSVQLKLFGFGYNEGMKTKMGLIFPL